MTATDGAVNPTGPHSRMFFAWLPLLDGAKTL
jgi:hypothetical protein